MISIQNTQVYNMFFALRGARNPMESYDRQDSILIESGDCILGSNDLALAQKLILAGTDHSKFMRQIFVSMDIEAPLYW